MFEFMRSGLRSGLRGRSFQAVFVLGVLTIGLAYLSGFFSPRQPQTVALDVGFSGIRFCLILLNLFWVQDLVAREIDRRVILFSLAYPVTRGAFLAGRFAAILILSGLAAIVLGGVVANLPFYALEIATGHPTPLTLHTLSVFLFLAIVPGVGAYLAYGKLVDLVGPARTGLLLYLIPLYNVGLAWILLGERPYPFHAVGMVLTLTGVWLGTRVPKQTAG